ncbi:MAG: CPBP family intramembrane metalloprotease [Deltaproteobacteria bacterium]|nr:CPBP family intramembrane metalloprotease [Deltaproteobacteria bacterium]
MNRKSLITETCIAWAVVITACHLAWRLQGVAWIAENTSLVSAVFLLYTPLVIYYRKKGKIAFLDASLSGFGKSVVIFLIFSAIIFPLAAVGNHFYQRIFFSFGYHPGLFPKPAKWALFQLLLVALPEEFFFRGYFLERMNEIFGKRWRLLGASVGGGLFVTSLVFALSHSLIHVQWWHIFIFFPALAFGWLKEKTGTITAPILFHTTANAFSYWVALHYF